MTLDRVWPILVCMAPRGKGLKRLGAPTRYFVGSSLGVAYGKGWFRAGPSQASS